MNDLISRKAAIDALKAIKYGLWEIDIPSPGNSPEYKEHHKQIQDMMGVVDNWIAKLSDLPSAEPEPKKGEWIDLWDSADPDTSHSCRCSECKQKSLRPVGNFCKWCGADMRGDQNDT